MKRLITISAMAVTSLVASAVLACPDLSGTYSCDGQPTVMTQSVVNGITVYSVDHGVYTAIADGVARTVATRSEEFPQVEETFTCQTDAKTGTSQLVRLSKGDVFKDGVKWGRMELMTTISIGAAGELYSFQTGSTIFDNGATIPHSAALACPRL